MGDFTLEEVIKTVHDSATKYGIERLASQMDMRPSTLYNVLNPYGDRDRQKLGLEQAVEIMRITGRVEALEMIAERLGYTLRPMDGKVPDKATWREELADAVRQGQLASCMLGKKTPEEVFKTAESLKDDIDQTCACYRQEYGKDR